MTTIAVGTDTLTVSFTRGQKLAGLIRDQHVPLTAVRAVDVVPDGLDATDGMRAPGLALPGLRNIGTWRARSGNTLVAVRAGQPALRISLEGQRYAALLLEVDDPERVAEALTAATA